MIILDEVIFHGVAICQVLYELIMLPYISGCMNYTSCLACLFVMLIS
jgi:hypothetical protein